MDTQGYIDEGLKKIVGEQIIKLRTEILKLNQKEFAEMIGITQPTLSMYEAGKAMPSLSTALTIALKGNVSIDWLCGIQVHLNTLADVMACFFELYEIEQFNIETTLHNRVDLEEVDSEDENERNWVGFKVFYNDYQKNPNLKFSYDICSIIERASNLKKEWNSYRIDQERYDAQKRYWIDYYNKNMVTKDNKHKEMSPEEITKRREELIELEEKKKRKKADAKKNK
jgi:transcriptional regulator with XRE-family HTH domain